jgi:hypothetical protein
MSSAMSNDIEPLVLDLVEWIAREPRTYADVFEAWRTSCPRLPVWEEACDRGLVARTTIIGPGASVVVTSAGRDLLRQNSRPIGPAMPERGAA